MNHADLEIELELDDEPGFALDRSARTKDADGRMRVVDCRISKSVVNDYIGYEIPGHEALGLDPNRIYRLYHDRTALQAAAPSFENVPLLSTTQPCQQTNLENNRPWAPSATSAMNTRTSWPTSCVGTPRQSA